MDESLRRAQEQDDVPAASDGKPPDGEQAEGAGTPEGGPQTGTGGVTRMSAGPGETGGYGADVRSGSEGAGGPGPEDQGEDSA